MTTRCNNIIWIGAFTELHCAYSTFNSIWHFSRNHFDTRLLNWILLTITPFAPNDSNIETDLALKVDLNRIRSELFRNNHNTNFLFSNVVMIWQPKQKKITLKHIPFNCIMKLGKVRHAYFFQCTENKTKNSPNRNCLERNKRKWICVFIEKWLEILSVVHIYILKIEYLKCLITK